MKKLVLDYNVSLDFSSEVTEQLFQLRCVPISQGCQVVINRSLEIFPSCFLTTSTDIFGNRAYTGRIDEPHKNFSFHSKATVLVDGTNGIHARCQPLYKYQTELTRCSEKMKDFLYQTFKHSELLDAIKEKKIKNTQIKEFAIQLMHSIHKKIQYSPGSTNVKTTAAQAFDIEKGVCQDYSHIFCSLCREAGIPARYIAGASVGEGATHAWADFFVPYESYVTYDGREIPGRWFGADCTRDKIADDSYVILAAGRDFSDCRIDTGIFRGNADQTMTIFIKTEEEK